MGNPAEIFIGYMQACGHYFHFKCIWTWLEAKGTCPLCREKVQLKEEDIVGLSLKKAIEKYNLQDREDDQNRQWVPVMTATEHHELSSMAQVHQADVIANCVQSNPHDSEGDPNEMGYTQPDLASTSEQCQPAEPSCHSNPTFEGDIVATSSTCPEYSPRSSSHEVESEHDSPSSPASSPPDVQIVGRVNSFTVIQTPPISL